MALLYGITLLVSALLLFWVQPMIAKMVLPLLGGVPAVWNTCMVFFQAMLLAGYVYAHVVTTRLRLRGQILLQLALLLTALAALPLGVSEESAQTLTSQVNPTLWLLECLASTIGLPFFIVSTSAPLLQRWFAATHHASAKDPYFLYSASNLGSLLALLSYPAIVEPTLRLQEQSRWWTAGYGLLIALFGLCAVSAWRSARITERNHELCDAPAGSITRPANPESDPIPWRRRMLWIGLAFVPSSLMLGVTNYLTTDIASVPLFWVVPLAIYLFTFIVAFAQKKFLPLNWMARLVPIGAVGSIFPILSKATDPVWLIISGHLFFFLVASLVCHGRLAVDRPPSSRLTEFYLCLSVGGVLGGIFNALVAPVVFNTVFEYPLAIVLACLFRPSFRPLLAGRSFQWMDVSLPVLLGVLTAGLAVMVPVFDLKSVYARNALIIGVPAVIGFTFVDRPVRFGLGLLAVVAGGWLFITPHGQTLHVERNFFGVSRVSHGIGGVFRHLVHGNTLHGSQFIAPERRCEPLTYYHRTGPLSDIFALFNTRGVTSHVAVIGLGAGSMAAYSEPTQQWTFYEIDPAVVRVAQDTNYFVFLRQCMRGTVELLLGDARLRLRQAPDRHYALIVLDAFSSDAIPVHLLTREAMQLYLLKLAEGGMLAFHISNRYLELEPVVGNLAHDADLVCRSRDDFNVSREELAGGKEESHWVVLARRKEDLGELMKRAQWLPVETRPPSHVWTDDFSDILSVFKWK